MMLKMLIFFQIWTKLCTNKCIPLSRQQRVLELTTGRIEVRKCCAFMSFYDICLCVFFVGFYACLSELMSVYVCVSLWLYICLSLISMFFFLTFCVHVEQSQIYYIFNVFQDICQSVYILVRYIYNIAQTNIYTRNRVLYQFKSSVINSFQDKNGQKLFSGQDVNCQKLFSGQVVNGQKSRCSAAQHTASGKFFFSQFLHPSILSNFVFSD